MNTRAGMKMSRIFLGGITGLALILPAFILRLKGYRCRGFIPVDLPSNWIPLHPGIKPAVVGSIFMRCERKVRYYTARLLSGRKVFRGLASLPVDLLISPVALGYFVAGRFFLSKTFIAGNRCNNCGKCIMECPTSSIRMAGNRPYWRLTCESCMRCLNNCPERAIESAHGMAAGFCFVIVALNGWLAVRMAALTGLAQNSAAMFILRRISGLILTVAVPALIYLIIHYASAFRPLRELLKITSLTSLRFWRRYHGVKK